MQNLWPAMETGHCSTNFISQRIEQDIPISRVRVSSARKPADYKEGDDIEVYTELPWKKGLVGWWKAKVLRTKSTLLISKLCSGEDRKWACNL